MGNPLFQKPDNVLTQILDEEMVLLNLDSECYFALDDVGLCFWNVLQDATSLDQAIDTLETEYEVDRETLSRDLAVLIDRLLDKGLLQRADRET